MIFLVVLAGELLLLLLFSRFIIHSLLRWLYSISKSRATAIKLLTVIFLPGLILHELAHLLMATALLVPVGKMEIFPQIVGDKILLGSVEVGETDPLRHLLIGIAPIIAGVIFVIGGGYLSAVYLWTTASWWQLIILVVLMFQIVNTMFSSSADMEGTIIFLGAIVVLLLIIYGSLYLSGWLAYWQNIGWLLWPDLNSYFKKIDTILLLPLLLDGLVSLILYSWSHQSTV